MDLSAYLLNNVVEATTPPNETEAAARARGDAIVEMVCAFDPRDSLEAMFACQCVMLQFLLNAAVRDASDVTREPAALIKARASAMALSRTLQQWVSRLEKLRKRNEAGTEKTARPPAPATAGQPEAERSAPEAASRVPVASPVASPVDRPAIPLLVQNGRAEPGTSFSGSGIAAPVVANGSHPTVAGQAAGDRKRTA